MGRGEGPSDSDGSPPIEAKGVGAGGGDSKFSALGNSPAKLERFDSGAYVRKRESERE